MRSSANDAASGHPTISDLFTNHDRNSPTEQAVCYNLQYVRQKTVYGPIFLFTARGVQGPRDISRSRYAMFIQTKQTTDLLFFLATCRAPRFGCPDMTRRSTWTLTHASARLTSKCSTRPRGWLTSRLVAFLMSGPVRSGRDKRLVPSPSRQHQKRAGPMEQPAMQPYSLDVGFDHGLALRRIH